MVFVCVCVCSSSIILYARAVDQMEHWVMVLWIKMLWLVL